MSTAAEPDATTTVYIGSVTAGKQRSFLVACSDCGGGYYLAARTVREMRAAGRRPVCRTCRRPDLVNVTDAHVTWARDALLAMTPPDREAVVFAFSGGRNVERVDLALAASAHR